MRLILLTMSFFLIWSCSSEQKKTTIQREDTLSNICVEKNLVDRHAKLFTLTQTSNFKNCLRNHLKIHKLENLELKVCASLVVQQSGKVSHTYVQTQPAYTDLNWCIEQELRALDLSLLSLERKEDIKFLINFNISK